ncbi:phage repressor protein CI [Kosakonia oryzendophytica]|uniref:phage repressor protein CI n=1 Tax=Kosakonia oryzendophytica TaxID=1005665 RepID=UPI003D32EC42
MDLRRGGKTAIDRIMKAYGFTTKQALCDKLGISSSTLANRYTRDSLPTDFIVQCAIETGASVEWLAFGTENNQQVSPPSQAITEQHHQDVADSIHSIAQKSPNEIKINLNQGGKAAIERLVEAYGFTTRQALADHLGISKSTLANRYLRDTFPADWIIQCALETGASLIWLTIGKGQKFDNLSNNVRPIHRKHIVDGELIDASFFMLDTNLFTQPLNSPIAISFANKTYIADMAFSEIVDGEWLVIIEGKSSIRKITRIPVGMVKVTNSSSDFECSIDEIEFIARCHSVVVNNI